MVVWEVENHDTKDMRCFVADSLEQIHETLTKLGYQCMVKYDCYCGIDDNGNEISCMPASLNHVSRVKPVNQKKTDNHFNV